MSKPFKDLTIKDAFMFAAVMVNPDKCGPFLEMVLDMEIVDLQVITEKTMVYHPQYHGIRLDVLAEERGRKRRFNIEMQVKSEMDLPKLSRYYHSQLDMDALLSGKRYGELPDTYVIFICDFPLSKKPLYKYSYHSVCSENGEYLEDGRITIFLSTCGENEAEVPKELVDFLKYVKNPGESPETEKRDSYEASVERQVQRIKRDREMEAQYMMLEEMLKDEREAGRKEGRLEGEEHEERTMELVSVLMNQGRHEDLKRCLEDRAFRQELLEQLGIKGKEKRGSYTED